MLLKRILFQDSINFHAALTESPWSGVLLTNSVQCMGVCSVDIFKTNTQFFVLYLTALTLLHTFSRNIINNTTWHSNTSVDIKHNSLFLFT